MKVDTIKSVLLSGVLELEEEDVNVDYDYLFDLLFQSPRKQAIRYDGELIIPLDIISQHTYIKEGTPIVEQSDSKEWNDKTNHKIEDTQNENVYETIKFNCKIVDNTFPSTPYVFEGIRTIKLYKGKYKDMRDKNGLLDSYQSSDLRNSVNQVYRNTALDIEDSDEGYLADKFIVCAPFYSEN